MKRLLTIVLIISVIMLVCSCKQLPNTNSTPGTTGTTQQSTSETTNTNVDLDFSQKPMYAISLPPVEDTEVADDGTVLFRCVYQNISLILPEQEVADRIIVDFLSRTDALIQHSEPMIHDAKQAYATSDEWNPYLLQLKYSPTRLDLGILSMFAEKRSYTGGAHSAVSGDAVTYDLLTGNALQLNDIMDEAVDADTLCQAVCDALDSKITNGDLTLFTTYKDTVKQLLNKDLTKYKNWYLSSAGLVFYFDPYEIAPFSEGTVTVEIPYDKLTGILNNAYFPAEEDRTQGDISVTLFEDIVIDTFTQFSEIILEEGTTKFLLHTQGAVSDITITAGPLGEHFANSAHSDSVVFAAHTLTPGDAIMVEADLTNTVLVVYYYTGEQYRIQTITMGNNGVRIE